MESGTEESTVSVDERDPFVITGEAEAWAEKYFAADENSLGVNSDLMRDVESDKVNYKRLETEVRRLLSAINVEEGFCAKCRHLLCHWPDLPTTPWFCSRDFGSVSEIEAAARAGCKFCALVFSRLGYVKQLDTFRKVEQRLAVLGHDVSTVLSTQRRGVVVDSHFSWLTLPGKRPYVPRPGCGPVVQFTSHVENPSGETFLLLCRKNLNVCLLTSRTSELVERKNQCV